MGVKASVGVSVCVGVNAGGSGVNVEVDVDSKVGGDVACSVFCVSMTFTVCATDVLTAFVSGVKRPDSEQAKPANNKTIVGK